MFHGGGIHVRQAGTQAIGAQPRGAGTGQQAGPAQPDRGAAQGGSHLVQRPCHPERNFA